MNNAIGNRTSLKRSGSSFATSDTLNYTYDSRNEVIGVVSTATRSKKKVAMQKLGKKLILLHSILSFIGILILLLKEYEKKLFISIFVFELFFGFGCGKYILDENVPQKDFFYIDNYDSLGLFFYSLNDEGILAWGPPSVPMMDPHSQDSPLGCALFRSPDFDWKENHEAFVFFLFMLPDINSAQKLEGKIKEIPVKRNGRFLIISGNKYCQKYVEAFENLQSDETGNLLAQPLAEYETITDRSEDTEKVYLMTWHAKE